MNNFGTNEELSRGCKVGQIRFWVMLATKKILKLFSSMSADADKIFYSNARFDDNVEITKLNNHVLVLRLHTKKFDHRNGINVQSLFCVIFQHILNIVF